MKMELKNEEEAMKLVKEFINDYLHGNIDELKNFSFWDLLNKNCLDYAYGGIEFDGDRTKIVYALDILIYKNSDIPEFSYGTLGEQKERTKTLYTGDTINTFNTLFGKTESDREKVKNIFPIECRKMIDEFYFTYQKIGNFYILPCKTLPNTKTSINSYRGDYKTWRDYFDTFRIELKKCLNHENDCDEKLYRLMEENDFFFSKVNDIDDFLSKFYMDDYKNFCLKEHFAHWYIRENMADKFKTEYIEFSLDYIQKATELINKRSKKLVEILKENLTKN